MLLPPLVALLLLAVLPLLRLPRWLIHFAVSQFSNVALFHSTYVLAFNIFPHSQAPKKEEKKEESEEEDDDMGFGLFD